MKPTFFATPAEFRAWFEAHHASAKELLVGFHKRGSGQPSITWPESVDEALCFGWIDGVRKSIDEDAYTIRFTPRKPKSIWSAINVAKVAALETLGRMTAAGRRAFAQRTPERTGVYSFERNEAARLDPDEERELRANAKAAEYFDAQPPWYRRTATHWVISPKRPATRRRRFEHLLAECARGRTIGPLTRKPNEGGAAASTSATDATATHPKASRAKPPPQRQSASRTATAPRAKRPTKKKQRTQRPARAAKKSTSTKRSTRATTRAGTKRER
ncbi:MAG TPA: YdeI/OmpD-associated family protein [Polyangiaceae bacterium]|nr:YdeI/OmpD-associated family protein [Polyangiaceae bacterium]